MCQVLYKAAAIKGLSKEAHYTDNANSLNLGLMKSAGLAVLATKTFCVPTDMLAPPLLCLKLGLTGAFLGDVKWFTLCNPVLLGHFFLVQPEVVA